VTVEPSLGQPGRPGNEFPDGVPDAVVAAHHAVQQAFGYNGMEAAAASLNQLKMLEKALTA